MVVWVPWIPEASVFWLLAHVEACVALFQILFTCASWIKACPMGMPTCTTICFAG